VFYLELFGVAKRVSESSGFQGHLFTKILNPITKPKPKKQHSFRFHEDLIHQSFPSLTRLIKLCSLKRLILMLG